MIRTDGRPTIAWAEPPATSEPQPEPPHCTPETDDERAIRMAIIRLGFTPKRAHRLAHAITHHEARA